MPLNILDRLQQSAVIGLMCLLQVAGSDTKVMKVVFQNAYLSLSVQ